MIVLLILIAIIVIGTALDNEWRNTGQHGYRLPDHQDYDPVVHTWEDDALEDEVYNETWNSWNKEKKV